MSKDWITGEMFEGKLRQIVGEMEGEALLKIPGVREALGKALATEVNAGLARERFSKDYLKETFQPFLAKVFGGYPEDEIKQASKDILIDIVDLLANFLAFEVKNEGRDRSTVVGDMRTGMFTVITWLEAIREP